jgi:DNA primase
LGEEQGDKGSRLLEENHLNTYVPRATTELKNAYVLHKIQEIKKELNTGNQGEMTALITQLQQLQEIKRVLSKELGERIVLRF